MTELELESLRALAGEVACDPKAACVILDETGVTADDLQDGHARALWAAIEAVARNNQPLDAIALSHRSGVPSALAVDVVLHATPGLAATRFELLRAEALRRRYLEALRQVARVVTDKAQPLANAVSEAARLLATWQDERTAIRPLDDALVAMVDELEEVMLGRRAPTLKTGLEALDVVIGGLQPTLTVIGAQPGVGKSALVAGLCRQLGARGVTVGVLSLEDERGWLPRRLMAEAAQVPLHVLANSPLRDSQKIRVLDAAAPLHKSLSHVLCDDRSGLSTSEVVASARKMISRGAKAVIVDHLGEIRLERSDRHDLDIADCLRDLRTVAKTNRIPVVVFAHMKRDSDATDPKLGDFAFSSGVERMARVALGLYRDKSGALRCAVLKQTQGVSGVSVALELNREAAVVVDSPATEDARRLYSQEDP